MRSSAKSTTLFRLLAALMIVGIYALTAQAEAPPGRYDMLTTTTLHDTLTGLTWQRTLAVLVPLPQGASVEYCTSLGDGWRLPTRLELLSIVDESRVSPAIDLSMFPGTQSELFWSSSSDATDPLNKGLGVNFSFGDTYQARVGVNGRIRCVR